MPTPRSPTKKRTSLENPVSTLPSEMLRNSIHISSSEIARLIEKAIQGDYGDGLLESGVRCILYNQTPFAKELLQKIEENTKHPGHDTLKKIILLKSNPKVFDLEMPKPKPRLPGV